MHQAGQEHHRQRNRTVVWVRSFTHPRAQLDDHSPNQEKQHHERKNPQKTQVFGEREIAVAVFPVATLSGVESPAGRGKGKTGALGKLAHVAGSEPAAEPGVLFDDGGRFFPGRLAGAQYSSLGLALVQNVLGEGGD